MKRAMQPAKRKSTMIAAALALALLLAPLLAGSLLRAQAGDALYESDVDARTALREALAQARIAGAEAQQLEAESENLRDEAETTARDGAALAARIQQSEAELSAAEARIALIERQRRRQQLRLAAKQQPVVELTAALQRMSRRPVALSLARPGTIAELVHLRAMLDGMVPVIRARTADLRAELAQGRKLRSQALAAANSLRSTRGQLTARRTQLSALESRQRIALRNVRGEASREADRAVALAEEARDLTDLVGRLEQTGDLRSQLAALPGPVLRPPRPADSQVLSGNIPAPLAQDSSAPAYRLPVQGRVIAGLGSVDDGSGVRSRGVTLATRSGAQLVAPASGRVAFAGPYRGFGQIIILEHGNGWTSLITGMASVSQQVGRRLAQGAPIGVAGAERPSITVELRKGGTPVDLLAVIAAPR